MGSPDLKGLSMNTIVLRVALTIAVVGAAAAAAAAPALTDVSLSEAASTASTLETRLSKAGENVVIKTTFYGDGDLLVAWSDREVLLLCRKGAYLRAPGKFDVASWSEADRQSIVNLAMASVYSGVQMQQSAAGDRQPFADDGSEYRFKAEGEWAYGIERYDVSTQRRANGVLWVQSIRTGAVENAEPSAQYEGTVSDEDRAARRAELPPTGTRSELLIGTAPRQARMDPGMSMKDWVPVVGAASASLAEARALHGCQ